MRKAIAFLIVCSVLTLLFGQAKAAESVWHWAAGGANCSECAEKRPCCDKTGECNLANTACANGNVIRCGWHHFHH